MTIFRAVALTLLVSTVSAADKQFAAVDEAVNQAVATCEDLQKCANTLSILKKDMAKKQAELRREFPDAPPPAFNDLLVTKRGRIEKQIKFCNELSLGVGKKFDLAYVQLAGVEPPNPSGLKERRAKLHLSRSKCNAVIQKIGGVAPAESPAEQEP